MPDYGYISEDLANAIVEVRNWVRAIRGKGVKNVNGTIVITGAPSTPPQNSIPSIPIVVTGRDASDPHLFTFKERMWDPVKKKLADKTGGLTDANLGKIRERTGRRAIMIGQDERISPSPVIYDGTTGLPVWEFDASIKWAMMRITAVAALGSTNAQWTYGASEVQLTGTSVSLVTNGLVVTTAGVSGADQAINLNELDVVAKSGTNPWWVDGINANSTTTYTGGKASAYAAGYAPRPIGGGGIDATWKINSTVALTEVLDGAGNYQFVFGVKMNHDGTCT